MADADQKSPEETLLTFSPAERLTQYQVYALGALAAPQAMEDWQLQFLVYGLFRDPDVTREQILPDFGGDVSSWQSMIPAEATTVHRTIASASGGTYAKNWDNVLYMGALVAGGVAAGHAVAGPAAATASNVLVAGGGAALSAFGRVLGVAMKALSVDSWIARTVPTLAGAITGLGAGLTVGAAGIEAGLGAEGRAALDAEVQLEGPVNPTVAANADTGIGAFQEPTIVGGQPGVTSPGGRIEGSREGSAGSTWGTSSAPSEIPPPWPDESWDFYGVPEGYVARAMVPNPAYDPQMASVARARHRIPPKEILSDVPPTFGGDDAWQSVNQLYATGQLESFQRMMENAGVLDEGKYLPGVTDTPTINAMISVMAIANTQGITDWRGAAELVLKSGMQNLEETREELLAPLFVNRTYVAPDYDSLAQGIKGLFRDRLGRDPHDYEIALFADQLQQDYRSEFDVSERARYQEFVAGNKDWNVPTTGPSGSMFDGPVGTFDVPDDPRFTVNADNVRTAGGGSLQGVDPAASFAEEFERRYAQEITNLDTKKTNQRAQERAIQLVSSIRSRLGSL